MTPSSDSSVTRCETCGHDHVCQHGYAANLGPDVWCCECDAGDDPFIALHPFVPAPAPSTDLASDEMASVIDPADERRVAEERIADLIAFIELLESDPGGCNRCSGSDEAEAMGQYVDRVHASRDLIARVDAIRALSKPTQEAHDGD